MITPNLQDGEAYVEGRSEATARKLYLAADKAGIDVSQISTTSHGYIVPKELIGKTDGVEEQEIIQDTPNGVNVATADNRHVTATGVDDAAGDPDEADGIKQNGESEPVVLESEAEYKARFAEAKKLEDETRDPGGQVTDFDPSDHTVAEIKEYLATADDAERDRVLRLETESDSPRQGVLKLAEKDEGDK